MTEMCGSPDETGTVLCRFTPGHPGGHSWTGMRVVTEQPFVMVPNPPGVTGLHFTDTHLLACGSCHAIIESGTMRHADDCLWIAAVRDGVV